MKDIGSILQDLYSDDNDLLIYRPALRTIAKSISSTILLSQILYWDKIKRKEGKTRFYKFKTPPESENPMYKDGDSWCEELNISIKEFNGALKNIGAKWSKKIPKDPNALVWYNTDINRVTWYELNTVLLQKKLTQLHDEKEGISRKVQKVIYESDKKSSGIYTENTYREHSLIKLGKPNLQTSPPATSARENENNFDYNGLLCPICKERQFLTPSGESCVNGHGGEIGIEKEKISKKPLKRILPKKPLKKIQIKKQIPNPNEYSPEVLQVINHWAKCGGKVHKNKGPSKGTIKIDGWVTGLLMKGYNEYAPVVDDVYMKSKQWTVKEIKKCIDIFAIELKKDISKMYFDRFIIIRTNGFKRSASYKDYSPLAESFKNIPDEETLKWKSTLEKKLKDLYPSIEMNSKVLMDCAKFLIDQNKKYEVTVNGASYGYHIRNVFVAYVRRIVTEKGTYDPLKYISSKKNLDDFIYHSVKKSFLLKKRTSKLA